MHKKEVNQVNANMAANRERYLIEKAAKEIH